jgi:drug/metabolite transporter (DMT)-like permease
VQIDETYKGVVVLLTVPVAWGTFEVAVRYVYALEPAIPAFLFSLAYYTVATTALFAVAAVLSTFVSAEKDENEAWPIAGGMELGFYLFAGNLLQVVGLQTVASDRAAFLLQLTTVFVPLAQAFVIDQSWEKNSVSSRIWMACGVALAGVGIMGLDRSTTTENSEASNIQSILSQHLSWDTLFEQLQWGVGDTLIVLAAVAYTFHCIRLARFAQTTSAVKLAACKASTETVLSAMSVAVVLAFAAASGGASNDGATSFLTKSGQDCLDFVSTATALFSTGSMSVAVWLPAALAVVWTGLVPVAYTIAAQSYGQSRVRPVTANLIYTIQPICTALFAYILLHETLGPAGYIGGALIGSAVLLVVAPDDSD